MRRPCYRKRRVPDHRPAQLPQLLVIQSQGKQRRHGRSKRDALWKNSSQYLAAASADADDDPVCFQMLARSEGNMIPAASGAAQVADANDLAAASQTHTEPGHQPLERMHELHRILTARKNALVILHHQPDALALPPGHTIVLVKFSQPPFHQLFAARIDFAQAADLIEAVGEIAATAAGDGELLQRRGGRLEHDYIPVGMPALHLYRAEAAGRAGTYDCSLVHRGQR